MIAKNNFSDYDSCLMLQESLLSQAESSHEQAEGFKAQVELQKEKIKFLEDEVTYLSEVIKKLKQQAFGPKSDRYESQEQICFNEAEVLAKNPKPENEDEEDTIEVTGHTKKRGKRKPLPENLPREIVKIELPESELTMPDGRRLKPIGEVISERLYYKAAEAKVIEYHRVQYGYESGDYVKAAPPVPSVIPKGIPEPSLLSHIIVQKYAYGMPLYRIEEMMRQLGVEIPRCTQARWIIQVAEALRPIWNILEERLMSAPYVSCDETWTQVLKEKGKTPESKSWMWVRCTPSELKKIVLFEYDPHRSADVAQRLFADYKGFLQVDGFASYNILEKKEGLIRIGCNMHGRRKFSDAHQFGAKKGPLLAEDALKFYQQLYDIEEKAKEQKLSFAERHELRQKEAKPLWDQFKAWADANHKKVPPRSKIGQAFHYFLNEYPYLTGYLQDGQLEMDNGFAERKIKSFALGRNAWLFSDTEAGAEASSVLYSLLITMHTNGVKIADTLEKIITEIPKAKMIEDFERLADLILTPGPGP